MNRPEWALLTIAAAQGEPLSPIQLQKSLFLIGRMFPETVRDDFYSFAPYNYGPFDRAVYLDAEQLANQGLVAVQCPPGQRWAEYQATPEGLRKAAELRKELDPNILDYVPRVVGWTRSLTFQQLVRAIYNRFPEFKANSVFRG